MPAGPPPPEPGGQPHPGRAARDTVHAADPDLVRAALAGAAGLGMFFALTTGDTGEPWRPAHEVYADGLATVIARTARQLGVTEPRVAAATVHLGYAARLWSPVLYCALVHGVVPDLATLRLVSTPSLQLNLPTLTGWQAETGQPDDLAGTVYGTVVDGHLEPLAATLPVKIARGLLRGNAASALAAALRVLTAGRPDLTPAARRLAQALLTTGTLRGTGALTGTGVEFLRRSCCLFYRVPGGGYCGDCPLPTHRLS